MSGGKKKQRIQQLDSAHQHSMVPSGNDAATPGWIAGETGVAPDLLSLPAVVHQNIKMNRLPKVLFFSS